MDVLLINAPTTFGPMAKGTAIPLGLAYIASYLKQKGFNTNVLDMAYDTYEEKTLKEFLLRSCPKVVGISFTTHTRLQALEIAKWVRRALSNVHITMGGHHVTSDSGGTLKNCDIDSIIVGDGEEAMYELCSSIIESDKDSSETRAIPGVIYKNGENVSKVSRTKAKLGDLDLFPWPDRNLFDAKKYNLIFPPDVSITGNRVEYLVTSRGCPYACKFCSTYLTYGKEGVRYRNITKVVDEIEYLMEDRKCDGLFIYDDNFTLNDKRIREFASEMTRRKIFIPFFCYGRVSSVKYDSFKLLREIGLQAISFGIESGSPRVLKYLNKNTNNNQAMEAVKVCNNLGILAKGTFIVGSPGETIEDFMQTLKLIYSLKKIQHNFVANIGASGMFIYPATGVFNDAVESGVLPRDFNWYKDYPEIKQNSNVPIYFNPEIEELLSKAPGLVRQNEIKYLLLNDPKALFRKLRNRASRLVKFF